VGSVSTAAFSPDGKRLAIATVDNVKLLDVQSWQEVLSIKVKSDFGFAIAFSPDGNRLGHVTPMGNVKIWNAAPLPERRSPKADGR
jgi:WD40 repeat protein